MEVGSVPPRRTPPSPGPRVPGHREADNFPSYLLAKLYSMHLPIPLEIEVKFPQVVLSKRGVPASQHADFLDISSCYIHKGVPRSVITPRSLVFIPHYQMQPSVAPVEGGHSWETGSWRLPPPKAMGWDRVIDLILWERTPKRKGKWLNPFLPPNLWNQGGNGLWNKYPPYHSLGNFSDPIYLPPSST